MKNETTTEPGLKLYFSKDIDVIDLSPWIHPEAEYEFMVHWGDSYFSSYSSKMGGSLSHDYVKTNTKELWVKNGCYITIKGKFPVGYCNRDRDNWEKEALDTFRASVKKVEVIGSSPLRDVSATFACFASMEEIDERIFENCKQAKLCDYLFFKCGEMTHYPANILSPLTNASTFESAFEDNYLLGVVPEGFFVKNNRVRNFSRCFCNCKSLQTVEDGATPEYVHTVLVLCEMFKKTAVKDFNFATNFVGISTESFKDGMFAEPIQNAQEEKNPATNLLQKIQEEMDEYEEATCYPIYNPNISVAVPDNITNAIIESIVDDKPLDEPVELLTIEESICRGIVQWCKRVIENGVTNNILVKDYSLDNEIYLKVLPTSGDLVIMLDSDIVALIENMSEEKKPFMESVKDVSERGEYDLRLVAAVERWLMKNEWLKKIESVTNNSILTKLKEIVKILEQ